MSRTISLASIWKSFNQRKLPWQVATILGVGLGVAGLVVGTKQLGWWEMGELAVYDRSVRWQPSLPKDPRILIVAISEEDLNLQKTWPLSDLTLATAIQKLTDAKAKVIGLDVFRPNPIDPGAPDLAKIWEQNDLIIPACQHRNFKNPGIAGPPGIPAEQLGFVDLLVDRDGIVRRALLFMARDPKSPCTSETSFALQLAQEYLIRQHQHQGKFDSNQQFSIGTAHFKPISSTDGGYQSAESGGYQILLNYRSPSSAADRAGVASIVKISDLLNDRVDPKLIKDRIVLIGSTASSLKDEFLTPYSAGEAEDATMPGVVVHAQIVSQILSAVLDQQSLWWFLPDGWEGIWIAGWCLAGSGLAWYIRHPLKLFGAVGGVTILLVGGFAIAFTHAGWLPLVSPVVGLIASSIGMLGLTSYHTQQQQQAMTSLAIDRDRAIADLQLLLTQSAAPVVPAADAVQPELPLTMAPTAIDPDLTVPHQLDVTFKQEQHPTLSVAAGTMPPNYLLDGRYQADRSLGSGGFGVTYLARDTKRPGKPQCVIKHLVPARRDPSFVSLARRLFNTEAEILAKLGHHAQIPHLLAYFEDRQEFYLVQEFIDGTPLDRELEGATVPWSEAKVLDLLRQLLPVLGFIHSQRVIHRDLKPGNIIRDRHHGKLVLIDFGAVKELQPQLTKEQDRTIAIGTRGYTPPEQYAGQPNYTSDIYSLGTIAIEALTNTHPRYLPVDDNTGDLIWHDRVSIDPQLVRVLDKMVAYHFRDRYQSATAVLIDLP